MRGLLADVNLEGHFAHLRSLLIVGRYSPILEEIKVQLVTFPDLGISRHVIDRDLWRQCQRDGWVLFTDNRNHDGPDSLQATIDDSWRDGDLPVITLGNKERFQFDRAYATHVADDVADVLFGISQGDPLDQPRIYVPR